MAMKAMKFYLTEQQVERLEEIRDRDGLTVSEQIRRALDSYLRKRAREDRAA